MSLQAPYYYHKLLDFDVEKWALGAGNSDVCDFFNRRKLRFEFNSGAALTRAVHRGGNLHASELADSAAARLDTGPLALTSPSSAYPRVPTSIEMAPTSHGAANTAAGACVVPVHERQHYPIPASGDGGGGFPVAAGGGGGFPVPLGGGGRAFPVAGHVTGTVYTAHSYNA